MWPHVDPWPHNFYPFLSSGLFGKTFFVLHAQTHSSQSLPYLPFWINKGILGFIKESKPVAIHYSQWEFDIIISCRWIKVLCSLVIALCSICELHLISPFVLHGLDLHPLCHTLEIFYSAYFFYRVGKCRRYGRFICVKEFFSIQLTNMPNRFSLL